MAKLRKIKVRKSVYYYLAQSIRIGNKLRQKRLYLGKAIPKDISKIKEKFVRKIYAEEWYPLFQEISHLHIRNLRKCRRRPRKR